MQMDDDERRAYDRHIDNIMVENDILETKVIEGLEQGRAEGRAEGLEQGRAEGRAEGIHVVAMRMKKQGMSACDIASMTGLTEDEISKL